MLMAVDGNPFMFTGLYACDGSRTTILDLAPLKEHIHRRPMASSLPLQLHLPSNMALPSNAAFPYQLPTTIGAIGVFFFVTIPSIPSLPIWTYTPNPASNPRRI